MKEYKVDADKVALTTTDLIVKRNYLVREFNSPASKKKENVNAIELIVKDARFEYMDLSELANLKYILGSMFYLKILILVNLKN